MISEDRRAHLAGSINKLQAYQEIQNEMGRVIAAVNFLQPG